jgi:branched-subunit amino acid ABC-type transport system permease component
VSIEHSASTLAMKTASAAQWGGSAVATVGGISANWVAAIGGIVIGAAGLAMNYYFKREHLKLARHRAGIPEGDD